MVCINILVLGLYHVMGWTLGAIEGVSITVLVGLSVDFCIHFSEAFVMSRLQHRKDRAQCAPLRTAPNQYYLCISPPCKAVYMNLAGVHDVPQ